MYKDMMRMYYWKGMKNDEKDFDSKCLTCHQVKFKQQWPGGKLEPLDISMQKWDDIHVISQLDYRARRRSTMQLGSQQQTYQMCDFHTNTDDHVYGYDEIIVQR